MPIGQGGTSLRGPLYIRRPLTNDTIQLFDATGQPVAGGLVIPSANIDPSVLQYVKFPLTAAQILALHGTPLTIVAAPGAGKYINLMAATLVLRFNSAQYAAGSAPQLKVGTIVVAATTAALVNAVAANAALEMTNPGAGTAQTNGPDNTALTLSAAGSEFTTGDSPGALHAWYSVITG